MPANLELDQLVSNPRARVSIVLRRSLAEEGDSGGGGGSGVGREATVQTLTGFIMEPLNFSTGNEWVGASLEESASFLSSISSVWEKLRDLTSGGIAAQTGQYLLQHLGQTVHSWKGSSIPNFQIRVLFIALRPEDDVVEDVQGLLKATMPRTESSAGGALTKVIPPLDYAVSAIEATASGTVMIDIGRWFTAPQQLISNVSPTFSKETLQNGKPLYADVQIQFHPFRLISYDEFMEYFRDQPFD